MGIDGGVNVGMLLRKGISEKLRRNTEIRTAILVEKWRMRMIGSATGIEEKLMMMRDIGGEEVKGWMVIESRGEREKGMSGGKIVEV